MSELTGADLAEARHRLWSLLGEALLVGLTPNVHARLAALPAVADTLPPPGDEADAQVHDTLSLQVLPWASVFLGATGQLGGEVAHAVAASFREGGFAPDTSRTEPDHVGLQLAYLAHLSAAEADAHRDGAHQARLRTRDLQRRFLDAHVLRWLPALVLALETQAEAPWLARIGRLALELAASVRADLGSPAELEDLPLPPIDLDEAATGLREVATHLATPAHAGLYLSRGGLAALAAVADLPAGFGPRVKMLESLLFTAVDHRRLPELLDALDALAIRWDAAFAEVAALGVDTCPWRTRLAGTRDLMARLRRVARDSA